MDVEKALETIDQWKTARADEMREVMDATLSAQRLGFDLSLMTDSAGTTAFVMNGNSYCMTYRSIGEVRAFLSGCRLMQSISGEA